jgi:hypothetical protein
MKPLETKYIKIGDKDYPFKNTARAFLKFEELSNHSIDAFDGSTKDGLNFLYSCFWGGGSRIVFDDFLELIDNEDVNDLIARFIKVMAEPVTEKKPIAR